ncbi:hypothetical protein AB0I72_07655 [Nocardiopsis sp. NPDC049922]|uniref:hypothetical protein n=1 Tax=Nocardiopsis sp. NPDC049922 TaxID=3155157 RepID=UPI0033ED9810
MDFADYVQNRRIQDLEESLGDAHASMTRQHSALSSLRGSLADRLGRVSATQDALVELSDIRATLAMFDRTAIARHRTLQMLDGAVPARLELDDAPDYWLVPAAHGLHALLRGDIATARVRFDDAAERDEERARHFAALAVALSDAGHARALGEALTAGLLPYLPAPSAWVTRGQRALWILVADGAFGEEAREDLLLSTVAAWSREEVSASAADALFAPDMGAGPRPRPRPGRGRDGTDAMAQRAEAASALAALRGNVARIAALDSAEVPDAPTAPDAASTAFLESALRILVEEGAPEEAPLLARARELRAVVEAGGSTGPRPEWGDTVGTVADHLDADLARDDAPPQRRAFALTLQRPAVLAAVASLVDRATEPVADASWATVAGERVALTSAGADFGDLRNAEKRALARHRTETGGPALMWSGLGLAGVFLLVGLTTGSVLALVLTVLGMAAALFGHRKGRREREEIEASLAAAQREVRQGVEAAVDRWRERLAAAGESAEAAERDAERVRALLGA